MEGTVFTYIFSRYLHMKGEGEHSPPPFGTQSPPPTNLINRTNMEVGYRTI